MREHIIPDPHEHPVVPLPCAPSDVRRDQSSYGGFTQRLSPYSILRHGPRLRHTPEDDISPRVRWSTHKLRDCSADHLSIYRFPERNKVPDFATFSSLLRITTKYELPAVRSQLLEVTRDAYPETFEGLTPSEPLGERVFSGPTPHPNEVLNLLVQQKLTSALPMAYYMAARRGTKSLIGHHPASARLPPEIVQAAIEGLMALHEMELKETHRLISDSRALHPCSSLDCPTRKSAGATMSDMHHKIVDQITGSSRSGTKVLEILSLSDICGGDCYGLCGNCVQRRESRHAEVRREAWAALPDMFGPRA